MQRDDLDFDLDLDLAFVFFMFVFSLLLGGADCVLQIIMESSAAIVVVEEEEVDTRDNNMGVAAVEALMNPENMS